MGSDIQDNMWMIRSHHRAQNKHTTNNMLFPLAAPGFLSGHVGFSHAFFSIALGHCTWCLCPLNFFSVAGLCGLVSHSSMGVDLSVYRYSRTDLQIQNKFHKLKISVIIFDCFRSKWIAFVDIIITFTAYKKEILNSFFICE